MLKPVPKRSLASEVFAQLRDHILDGELEVGAALPAERTLSEQLGVNRSAVREGLKRLEQAGLVLIQQGGATRVRDYKRSSGLEILGSVVVRGGMVDTKAARGILELRSELAPIVARLAAARIDAEQRARLEAIVEQMGLSESDVETLQRLALDFWAVLVDGTNNVAFELAFNSLANVYGSVIEHLTHVLADEVEATRDYAALCDAVGQGQAKRAGRLASKIVARGAAAVESVLAMVEHAQGDVR